MSGLLILCATAFEMNGFLAERPGVPSKKLKSGALLYTGPGWHCLVTGPGVFNTAMGLGSYLETHAPDLILDTGIAGAFEGTGLVPGDIALATREQYLHSGVGNDPFSCSPLPFELIPGHPESCQGIYPFDRDRVSRWRDRMDEALGGGRIITGRFLTVSGITWGRKRANILYERFLPVMESMEGAAAAHVAQCRGIPMIEIRAVSNTAGERDKEKWDFSPALEGVKSICLAALASRTV